MRKFENLTPEEKKSFEELSKKPDAKKFFSWVDEEYCLQTNGIWCAYDRGMAASKIGVAKSLHQLYEFFHENTVFNLGFHKILF